MRTIVSKKQYLSRVDYKFIKQQMKEKKLKMKDFAHLTGLSRSALYDMLTGKYPINLSVMTYLEVKEIKVYDDGVDFDWGF